jgi:hypothetical protein
VTSRVQADKLRRDAEEHKSRLSVWWHDLERTWDQHLAKIRDDVESKRRPARYADGQRRWGEMRSASPSAPSAGAERGRISGWSRRSTW